ncbi:hypothetical protein I316_03715 [Kwoniella heveanensis BCC8398]|uniref:Methyltransferase n=1 Tax=Kwoniella heveanensis BCC8398 TaxID=1296120 RepID=A0A1B9GUK3_9TREE|nr:hypothetical protein I316_03715 [Kwoniella heveanensis BCC8398]
MTDLDYPSIISQEGSAERNIAPLIDALTPLLSDARGNANGSADRRHILEMGSYPYVQIKAFSEHFNEWEWWGTVRDKDERAETAKRISDKAVQRDNLHEPKILDMGIEADWTRLLEDIKAERCQRFMGVLMINVIHCCPAHLPEEVFKHLSPLTEDGRRILDPTDGFVVGYSPFLNDDGSYRSAGDEKFDKEYIKAEHPSLGLRTIRSISAVARRWGFKEEKRVDMPKGNVLVVWRVDGGHQVDT